MFAQAVASAMAADRAVIRVGLRDLEQFPDLLDVLWNGLLVALYREIAEWLKGQPACGQVGMADPAATAAVLVASLTYYRVLQALIGHPPGDIDAEAYLAAWIDSAVATINPGADR